MFGTEKWNYWMDSHWIKFEGDSIINDTLFKVIYRSDKEFHDRWYRYGAIREDTLKRVFIHRNGQQHLLYDFNLEVGDSLKNRWDIYVYVIGIDSVKMGPDSTNHIRIFLNDWRDTDHYYSYWIEGIGSEQGVLSGADNIGIVGAVYSLICYYSNDTLIFNSFPDEKQNPCFPQGYPNGVDEIKLKKNIVDVIYGDHSIRFSFNNPKLHDAEMYIYDDVGRIYMKADLRSYSTFELLKEQMAKGIYIFHYRSGQEFESGKIIIK